MNLCFTLSSLCIRRHHSQRTQTTTKAINSRPQRGCRRERQCRAVQTRGRKSSSKGVQRLWQAFLHSDQASETFAADFVLLLQFIRRAPVFDALACRQIRDVTKETQKWCRSMSGLHDRVSVCASILRTTCPYPLSSHIAFPRVSAPMRVNEKASLHQLGAPRKNRSLPV